MTKEEIVFRDYFKKFNLSDPAVKKVFRTLQSLFVKRGERFSHCNRVCKRAGFLVSGLLYASYIDEEGKEIVSRFYYAPKNMIVSSFQSFQDGKPANEYIEAIEDSYLLCISRDDLAKLYRSIGILNFITRIIAEQSYVQALQRIHFLQALSNEQKIKEFLKDDSELVNKVKVQQLASYLGMHRNQFTRLLRKNNFATKSASEGKQI